MHVVRFMISSCNRRFWFCKQIRIRSMGYEKVKNSKNAPLIGLSVISTFTFQPKIVQLKSFLLKNAFAETRRRAPAKAKVHKIDFEPYEWNEPSFMGEIFHAIYVVWRCFLLMLVYGPVLVTYQLIRFNYNLRRRWWRALFVLTQYSGPIFIKFGQWIASRRDLFAEELCDMFAELQRRTPPHAWHYTEQVLVETFGQDWEKFFSEFDKSPCGSGCIAQVHKARLELSEVVNSAHFNLPKNRHDEYVVAVKILHPSVGKLLRVDLSVLRFFISMASALRLSKAVDLKVCLDQFSDVLWKQIDLRFEGRALRIFKKNFEGISHVRFPEPFHESPFVLVETYEEGLHINDYIQHPDQSLKHKLASWGAGTLFKMIFKDNFVHGDLHAGNIIVQQYDSFSQKGRIAKFFLRLISRIFSVPLHEKDHRLVLLDTGLVVEMKENDLDLFRQTFIAIIQDKGRVVADLMLENAPVQTCPDIEAFRKDIEILVHKARVKPLALGEVNVSKLLTELFSIVEMHEVKLETTFTSVVLAVIILEGLGRSLDPSLNLFVSAKEYLI